MRHRIAAALITSMMLPFTLPALAQAPAGLGEFIGAYKVTSIMVFHVWRNGDTLLIRPSGGPQMALLAEGPGRFTEVTTNAQFVFSGDGPDMELTASQSYHVFHAKRISEDTAKALEDAVAARFKAGVPSPGTEDSVRRYIDSLEKGTPNYDEMEPRVAEEVRQLMTGTMTEIHRLGALKSLTFTAVTPNGMDVYDAGFEHGHVMVGLAPLDAEGKVEFRSWSVRG